MKTCRATHGHFLWIARLKQFSVRCFEIVRDRWHVWYIYAKGMRFLYCEAQPSAHWCTWVIPCWKVGCVTRATYAAFQKLWPGMQHVARHEKRIWCYVSKFHHLQHSRRSLGVGELAPGQITQTGLHHDICICSSTKVHCEKDLPRLIGWHGTVT